ncbi:hypothetical protein A2U01_0109886, partial [Trifolium medium]|nr:hypothetical protein [Trifolium medium]
MPNECTSHLDAFKDAVQKKK